MQVVKISKNLNNYWQSLGFIFFFCILLSPACSTPGKSNLQLVKVGMDKTDVLELIGSPRNTLHRQGRDIWTYSFFTDNNEDTQEVQFEDGKVVVIGPPNTAIKNSKDLDEYEKAVEDQRLKKLNTEPIN